MSPTTNYELQSNIKHGLMVLYTEVICNILANSNNLNNTIYDKPNLGGGGNLAL